MRTSFSSALIVFFIILGVNSYAQTVSKSQNANPSSQENTDNNLNVQLERGTPVKLRLTRPLRSSNVKAGEIIDFEVVEEVKVDDIVVIPRKGSGYGAISNTNTGTASSKTLKLALIVDMVELLTGEKVPLHSTPIFSIENGKQITIPKGTEITAYIKTTSTFNKGLFLRSRHQIIDKTAISQAEKYSRILTEDSPFVSDDQKAIMLCMNEFLNLMKVQREGYRQEMITDGKIGQILNPQHLKNATGLTENKLLLQKLFSIIDKYEKKTETNIKTTRESLSALKISDDVKQQSIKEFDFAVKSLSRMIDEQWSLEKELLRKMESILVLLEVAKGWSVENGMFRFQNEDDVTQFNSIMKSFQDTYQKQIQNMEKMAEWAKNPPKMPQ